jgi:transcriptional regulator with XRE-family HTH domain
MLSGKDGPPNVLKGLGAQKRARPPARRSPKATNEPFHDLPERLKKLRRSKKLTLTEMASLVGLTKGFLSRVENGFKGVSIPTLLKIATALEVPTSYFFNLEPEKAAAYSIVRPRDRKVFKRSGTEWDYHFQALASKKARRIMEPMITSPSPNPPPEPFVHAGEEMLLVLTGRIRLELGSETFTLEPGDCAYYDGAVPHRSSSIGRRRATAVLVIASTGGQPLPLD